MESRNQARLNYCLSVSLTEPPEVDPRSPFSRRDRFNVLLAEQINSHLEKLGLKDALLKFGGDCWLLLTSRVDKVPALCCLATVLAGSFKDEISRAMGIAKEHVPSLRQAISSGRDRLIELPDGRRDWIGESARKATQLSTDCEPDGILIDGPVSEQAKQVFDIRSTGPNSERLVLGEIKIDAVIESGDPDSFVYTLGMIGKLDEAAQIAQKIEEKLTGDADKPAPEEGIDRWNRLMASLGDYPSALTALTNIRTSGLSPDVVTYNNLISKASDFGVASRWLETMQKEGINPDTRTYGIIAAKVPDYETAKSLLEMMRQNGLKVDIAVYNNAIFKSPDYVTARQWLETMQKEGVKPDASTYNALISKSPDYETADIWLGAMIKGGIQPNSATYGALIAKTMDFNVAKFWLDEMQRDGVQPGLFVYNKLVSKAAEYADAKSAFEEMQKEGIQPNVITYNALITKSTNFDGAMSLLEGMQKAGIQPNSDSYTRLFSKNLSGKSAEEILTWYRAQGVGSDEPIQAAMAAYRKAGHIDQALRLAVEYPQLAASKKMIREIMSDVLNFLQTMQEEGIQPSVDRYNALIDKAPYYETARSWFDVMCKKNVKPNAATYELLIAKSTDYETGRLWLEMMRNDGIKPSVDSYNRLFSKNLSGKSADEILKWYLAQGYDSDEPIQVAVATYQKIGLIDQALRLAMEYPHLPASQKLIKEHMEKIFSYMDIIREEGIKPNVVTYSSLISKAPYYDIAESWLETMRKKGVQPNVVTYNTLISKAPDYETAREWLGAMRQEGITPTVVTYGALISKAADFGTARSLFDAMKGEGVEPNVVTYNALILKAPNFETIKSVLEIMRQEGIHPDINSYNALVSKAPDFETAMGLIEMMKKEGIQPNLVTYNRLFSKNLAKTSAEEAIDWYKLQKYHPEEPIQAAIAAYRNAGRIEEALRMVLEYPHLQVARKLIKEHKDEAAAYFKAASDYSPRHPNADFALGLAFMETGKQHKAEPHLRRALGSSAPGPKRAVIEEYLRRIERKLEKSTL